MRRFKRVTTLKIPARIRDFAEMKMARTLHYTELRVSPTRVCGLGGVRMSSTFGPRTLFTRLALNIQATVKKAPTG
jgi:hypothetical protein